MTRAPGSPAPAAVPARDGLLNILKPPGMTSHDVVARVRRLLGVRRVGHTGTLDPGAAGVLVLCVGRATRLVELLQEEDKAYRAEMCLGAATDTQDAFGEVVRVERDCAVDRARLREVMQRFVGPVQQVPPMTSAIRHQGRRLYELAREGVAVPREPRTVRIHRLELVRVEPDAGVLRAGTRITFDVTCSKGTYVRTLCADMGEALGCAAFMSFLLRTRVGELDLGTARTLEELEADAAAGGPVLLPMDAALSRWPRVDLPAEAAARVAYGQPVAAASRAAAGGPGPERAPSAPDEGETRSRRRWVRLYDPAGNLLALAEPEGRGADVRWRPRIVFS